MSAAEPKRRRAGASSRHTRRRPAGPIRVGVRQFRADPWTSVLLAVLVAVLAALSTIGPRLLTDLNARQLDYTLANLSVVQRDLRTTEAIGPAPLLTSGSVTTFAGPEQTWAPMREGLDRVRDEQPEPLRSIMQPGRFFVDVDQPITGPNDPQSDIAVYNVQFRVDPLLKDLVTLTQGDWPAPTPPMSDVLIDESDEVIDPADLPPIEIALNRQSARRLAWDVGEQRDIGPLSVALAGIYVADDPDDSHWAQSPFGADIGTFYDGNVGTKAKVTAYLAPGNSGALVPGSMREVHAWFTLDSEAVSSDDVDALSAQIAAFTAAAVTVVDLESATPGDSVDDFRPRFLTEISDDLRDVASEQRATASILAITSAGPIGVALALFALGATLVVHRRRSTLTLATARGGSRVQIGALLAAEVAALTVPAAALGYAVAHLVIGPDPTVSRWPGVGLAAAIGMAPAAIIAASAAIASSPSLRSARSDLGVVGGTRRRRRVRLLLEISALGLAVVATWQLLGRGLNDAGGVDPLLAATPLLLALAAAVLTLRIYPLPLRAVARSLHSRAPLTPFLGAARAVRDPAGGLIPALAMILGVSVITFSTVLSSTITLGAERAAWNNTGAQIRLSGPSITDELMDTIRATPGVAEVARVDRQARTVDVIGEQTEGGASVFIVSDTLAQVHASAPLVTALPPSLYPDAASGPSTSDNSTSRDATSGDSTALPVLTGGAISQGTGTISISGIGAAQVVGHIDELPGVRTTQSYVVVARSAWEAAGRSTPAGEQAFISVTDDDLREKTADAVREAVSNALVQTPQERLDAFTAAPVTSGLAQLFLAAVLVTTGLTVLAILLVQALGGSSRLRLLALLRTMGASRADIRALTVWEIAPLLAAAGLAGALLGAVVPWLLLRAIDLRGLTGSVQQPQIAIDPWLLGAVTFGVLAVVGLGILISVVSAMRTDLARHVRLGEER